jgi:hypothetical protein
MGAVRGLLRTAIAVKAFEIIRREAAKPENQERARQLARRVAQEVQQRRAARSAARTAARPDR